MGEVLEDEREVCRADLERALVRFTYDVLCVRSFVVRELDLDLCGSQVEGVECTWYLLEHGGGGMPIPRGGR